MFAEILNHPLISLLDRFTRFRPRYSNDGTSLSRLLASIEFPNFNRDELFNISSLIRKGKDVHTVLITVSQLFNYNPKIVEKILSFNLIPSDIALNNYLICAILMNLIGWLAEKNVEIYEKNFRSAIDAVFLLKKSISQKEYNFLLYTISATYSVCPNLDFPTDMIPKIFSHSSIDGFDSAVLLLLKLKHHNRLEEERFLQNFILVSLSRSGDKICDCNLTNICYYIETYVSEFDDNALKILRTLGSYKDDENIRNLFGKLPLFIFSELSKSKLEDFPKPLENALTKYDTLSNALNLNLEMKNFDYFPNGLIPPPANVFENTKKFEDFMKPENISLALKIIDVLTYVLDFYNSIFFKAFAEHLVSFSDVQFFLIFIYILTHSKYTENDQIVFEALTSPLVFTPGLNVFNPTEGLELLSFMRKTIIYIFANVFPNFISSVLFSLSSHPFLFSEIVGRIQTKLESFDLYDLTDEVTLSSIIEVINTLAYIQVKEKELDLKVQQARSTLILFIFSLLDNQTMALRCFTSSVFSCGFLSHITEDFMQGPMIRSLRHFLSNISNQNIELLPPFCEFICGIIDLSRETKNGNDKLVLDLLSSVNEAASHSVELSNIFKPLASSATKYLIARPSESMLKETLQFFVQISVNCRDKALSLNDVQNLSKTIKFVEENTTDAILASVVNILAKSKSITTDAMFFIQEPNAVILLYSVLRTKDLLTKYLSLFISLCKHCIHNCQMCHEGCLDVLLIEIIRNENKEFMFRDCTLKFEVDDSLIREYVLPLLKIICTSASSPQIPAKLISLMIPHNETVPKYALDTMGLISSSISILSTEPPISYLCGKSEQYTLLEGLRVNDLAEGFSVSFKFNVDVEAAITSNIRPLIFQLTDGVMLTFQIFVRGNSLIARTVRGNDSTSIATLCPALPSCSWHTCITNISFYEDNIGALAFSFDENPENYFSITFPNFERNELTLQLGGIAEITDVYGLNNVSCSVSDFKLYGTVKSPENSSISSPSSSSTMTSSEIGKILYPNPHTKLHATTTLNNKELFNYNLYNAFIEGDNTKLLIPLFLFIDKMPTHFAGQLIDTIASIVTTSKEAEENFDSVQLMYRYLSKCASLSYSVFNKFVSFFSNCTTNRLVNELLEYIIFNVDLWAKTDAASLHKISQYWSTIASYEQIEIKDIIPKLRIYFWYEPIESELIFKERDPKIDIDLVRYNFDKLLINLNFTKNDFLVITSHCSTCVDYKQVNRFLSILNELVLKNPGVVPNHYCKCLFHLFKPKQNRRFMLLLQLICNLSGPKLLQYLTIMVFFISDQFIDKELFNEVLELQKAYPEVYVVTIWMAQMLDEECKEKVAISLRDLDIHTIVGKRFWYIPIVLLAHSSGAETRALVNVFYSKVIKDDPNAFFDIEMIYRLLCYTGNYDEDVYIKPLLFNYPITNIKQSIQVLLYHILFHTNEDSHMKQLSANVFGFEIPESIKKKQNEKVITVTNLREFLQQHECGQPTFRIRINEDMSLKDLELITMLMENKENFADDPFINYFSLLVMQSLGDQMNNQKKCILQEFCLFVDSIILRTMKSLEELRFSLINFFNFSVESQNQTQNLITIATEGIAEAKNQTNYVLAKDNEDDFISKFANKASVWSIIDEKTTLTRDSFVQSRSMSMPRLKPTVIRSSSEVSSNKEKATKEKPLFETECTLIDIGYTQKVFMQIYRTSLVIYKANKVIRIPLNKSTFCLQRKKLQNQNLVEIFSENESYLIDFGSHNGARIVADLERMMKTKLDLRKILDEWCSGKMSNFDYILNLNMLSGRSFHDAEIYPIFPRLYITKEGERDLGIVISECPLSSEAVQMYLGRIHPFDSSKFETTEKERVLMNYELTPEFFLCPEYFKDFTKKPFDFIIRNRKKLESPEVSRELHKWIDLIFGVSATNSSPDSNIFLPNILFIGPHPNKTETNEVQPIEKRLKISLKFSHSSIVNFTDGVATFYAVEDNKLYAISASYNTGEGNITNIKNSKIEANIFATHETKFVAINTDLCSVSFHSQNDNNNSSVINFRNPSFFSSSGSNFVIANRFGLIQVNDNFSFVATTDEITCLGSSSPFNAIVIGTVEKSVVSYDMNGRFLFSASVDSRPLQIRVTPSLGIIIVLCIDSISLFTINGTPIGNIPTQLDTIRHIICADCNDGVDRVFIVDDKGRFREINICEDEPSLGGVIFKCHGDVSSAGFDCSKKCFVSLKSDGSLFFIPYK